MTKGNFLLILNQIEKNNFKHMASKSDEASNLI